MVDYLSNILEKHQTITSVVTIDDYHLSTYANFEYVDFDTKEYEKISKKLKSNPQYKSPSGSVYYFDGEYLYRESNHWGVISSCFWQIQNLPKTRFNSIDALDVMELPFNSKKLMYI